MTALQAYLQNSKTRKALSKKPGEAGFSLIELVVVVAVLAVLAAIAIPAYNNITEKGRTSSGKTALANVAKECAVSKADTGNATHSALVDGSGLSYSSGLTGTTCTGTTEAVCVNNSTPLQYSVNLSTGTKNGAITITAVSPCTGTTSTAW
ncbi:MAG: prepilin-type N-terminal cleavage/methylation domain-containing protein [Chitinophagia bacterium]|nr:prepilin-type N-terminal cleavage/methylation domain-containing protein [Chitinophagia bacterium]